jgi:Fe-S oxidoreductase
MCNGAGVCRKSEYVMCPSFQATHDETFSTRGRANLLRAMMAPIKPSSGKEGKQGSIGSTRIEKVWESLDMCLACKGCKSECPSGVDMAKLKYEYMHHYYISHHRRLRDYLFGYIGVVAPLGSLFAPIVNCIMRWQVLRRWMDRFFGLSCHRPFPTFAPRSAINTLPPPSSSGFGVHPTVLFLRDTFNHYFYPEVESAALRLLDAAQVKVKILPITGAGRTLISKGFLPAAKKHAARVIAAINRIDPEGNYPIVGLEPSEIYTLRDEFLDFFPDDKRASDIANRVWMIDEYLIRAKKYSQEKIISTKVFLHGHCYQKSRPPASDGLPTGVGATAELLKLAGYTVEVMDDGCCGMAGAFGYEAEHFDTSMKVGELVLFPVLKAAIQAGQDVCVAAPGVSCRAQIEDGTGIEACHPVQMVVRSVL